MPKAKLYRLTGATLPLGEPLPKVVALARSLYRQALRGEISGLGVFYVSGSNAVTTDWSSGCAPLDLMTSGASKLQYRILKAAHD